MDNPIKKSRTVNYFESNPIEQKELEKKRAAEEALEKLEKKSTSKSQDQQAPEREEAAVKVSKEKPSQAEAQNSSHGEDEKIHKSRRVKKALTVGLIGLFIILLLVGGCFGLGLYETYLKKVEIEKVLKGDVSVVLNLNTDTEFEQYKLLDEHLKKFPGYALMEKELDDVGEGKSPSQFIQDKLKENNLNFHEDIQAVIGKDLFVLFPNLESLEKSVRHRMSSIESDPIAFLGEVLGKNQSENGHIAQISEENKVLGMTTDYYAMGSEEVFEMDPIDFIIASPIKDLREAKRVLGKIKSDKEAYETQEKKLEGYTYFEIKKLNYQRDKTIPFDVNKTYHALIGGNWVMSTAEGYLQEMITERKSNHAFSSFKGPFKKETKKMVTLSENQYFKNVLKEIKGKDEKNILTGYFQVNFKKFFSIPEVQSTEYFKYPEKFTGGFIFKAEQEGIAFRTVSNQISLENAKNSPHGQGLVEKIPEVVDGRFTDIYLETENVKDLYYDFKRNNLTKEGLEEWESTRKQMSDTIGVDFEKDLIDQLSGNVAMAVFAKRGLEPEGAIIADIADKDKVVESARKMIEMVKSTYMGIMFLTPFSTGQGQGWETTPSPIGDLPGIGQNEEMKKLMEEITNSQLVETPTENGTIYSYKLPGTEFSFDFGFSENVLVLGSHFAAVNELLSELKSNAAPKLVASEDYNLPAPYLFSEGYSRAYVNTFGLWNAVDYYLNHFALAETEQDKDMFFAIGSIVRTFNIMGAVDATSQDGKSAKSSVYMNVKELPEEEKSRAESILEKNL